LLAGRILRLLHAGLGLYDDQRDPYGRGLQREHGHVRRELHDGPGLRHRKRLHSGPMRRHSHRQRLDVRGDRRRFVRLRGMRRGRQMRVRRRRRALHLGGRRSSLPNGSLRGGQRRVHPLGRYRMRERRGMRWRSVLRRHDVHVHGANRQRRGDSDGPASRRNVHGADRDRRVRQRSLRHGQQVRHCQRRSDVQPRGRRTLPIGGVRHR